MTFFYDLNKRLKEVLDTPKSEHKQLNERDMSRAAKGYEKYGKEGMEALAKAGREGKALDPIRKKYDKYDDKKDVEEGLGSALAKGFDKFDDTMATVGAKAKGLRANITKKPEHRQAAVDAHKGIMKKEYGKHRDTYGQNPDYPERIPRYANAEQSAAMHKIGLDNNMEEGLGDVAKKVGGVAKKVGSKVLDKLGHGSDEDMIRDLQKKMGVPQTGLKPGSEPNPKIVKEKMSAAKAKSFAALAEPKDKITFADKIAGAKKEVDEMLGDVAAEAMKQAIGGKKQLVASEDDDNNPFTSYKKPRVDKPKVGSVERGHKHDIEHTATGRKVTRRVDDQGMSVGSETDDEGKKLEKRGRGRPKGPAKAPERVTAKATKHKGGRKMTKEEVDEAIAALEEAGYSVEERKLTKPEMKKREEVVKSMKKSKGDFEKRYGDRGEEVMYATATKIAKKKPEGKKKEKTEEAGGTGTPTASSGFSYGKGIYDSMNHDLEAMIAESMARLDATLNESMSVNMSNSTEGGRSLTVTATEDDAMKLASILKMAGLGSDHTASDHGVVPDSDQGGCGEELDEVDENQPDYPTNTETSDDALQYSGGLNAPKSTGQTTVPVIASQDDRQHSYAEMEEDAIRRMMEMAGIKKKDVEEEKTEEGNLFTGNLAKARSAGKKQADLDGDGDMEKVRESVDESILDATRSLWKTYRPQ